MTARVLYLTKGTEQDAEIDIYYGANSINGRYVATLVWDESLNGYRYFDSNMGYEVFQIDTGRQAFLNPQEIAEARGYVGEVVKPKGDKYYIPHCTQSKCGPLAPEYCQEAFDQIQFLMQKRNDADK